MPDLPQDALSLAPRHTFPLRVSIATYNILAELYCQPHTYPHCPGAFTDFAFRRRSLLRNILQLPSEELPREFAQCVPSNTKPCCGTWLTFYLYN